MPQLGHRPATAASIRPLVQELPHASGVAVKKKKKRKKADLGPSMIIVNIFQELIIDFVNFFFFCLF